MKDKFGNEVVVGDRIVYAAQGRHRAELHRGTIIAFFGISRQSYDWSTGKSKTVIVEHAKYQDADDDRLRIAYRSDQLVRLG